VTLKDCGHFAYLECPEAVHRIVEDFLRSANDSERSRSNH